MTTTARRRSQSNKGMPYLTNRWRSHLSGPGERDKIIEESLEPRNPSVRVMATTDTIVCTYF